MESIYDRLGGRRPIELIVDQFYQTILADDRINVFYIENVSQISELHHSVTDFFSQMFGGPALYKGKDMVSAHKHMKIEKYHFDTVWGHM